MTSLGILTVATNRYINYWREQAASVDKYISGDVEVTFHVFTDNPKAVVDFGKTLRAKVHAHPVESYGWPDATLYRYALISKFASEYSEDFLMHLDADTIARSEFGLGDMTSLLENGICLVHHPGFFRPKGSGMLGYYFRNMGQLFSDTQSLLIQGGIGSWETNPESLAFVPRKIRHKYVCGGVWWGTRAAILEMVRVLADRVVRDESNGILAVWHDESHLNWWSSQNLHGLANPSFCYAEGYPQLKSLPVLIEAVDKTTHPL